MFGLKYSSFSIAKSISVTRVVALKMVKWWRWGNSRSDWWWWWKQTKL